MRLPSSSYRAFLVLSLGLAACGGSDGGGDPDGGDPGDAGPDAAQGTDLGMDDAGPDLGSDLGPPTDGGCTSSLACDDGDACTVDTCGGSGDCVHTAVSVDDGDACTADACDPTTGVSHTAVNVDDGDVCTTDACDPATGVSHTPVSVDDGDACTADACDPTTGVSHAPVSLDDADVCTTDACDPATGVSHTPVSVDDGDACTADACDPTTGISHAPVSLDDADACTADACDPTSGVSHTAVSVDDGDACTADACDPTTGVSHTPVSADDGDACTVDACDPATGVSHTAVNVDDGDVCTTDACDPTTGVSHTAVSVDDADACTDDACDPVTGVSHVATVVDDGNACTVDACDTTTGVSHTAVSIDDGVSCTIDACDTGTGAISHTTSDALCERDGYACTVPTCDAVLDCVETPTDSVCDDGVACTTPDTCIGAGGDVLGCSRPANDALCGALEQCSTTGCAPAAQRGSVLVTELQVLGTEFVELYNASGAPLDLTGFTLRNASGATATLGAGAAGDLVLDPGEFARFVPNPVDPGTLAAGDYVYGDPGTGFALDDAGDYLVVTAADSAVEDYVDFRTIVTAAGASVPDGAFPFLTSVSTQLSSALFATMSPTATSNDSGSAWCGTFSATASHSAGAANHGCAIALLNELLIDPTATDDGSVFIELVGPAGGSIGGMQLQDAEGTGTNAGTLNATFSIPAGVRIPLDGFAVVADATVAGTTTVANADVLLTSADLENGGDDGLMLVASGVVLDAVGYQRLGFVRTTLIANGFSFVEGTPAAYPATAQSLARVAPAVDTGNNATDFFADASPTPGAPNVP